MKSLLAQLGRLFSLRVAAIGLTFMQTIALTRVFGGEVFGYLSVGLSVSALLVLLLSFGLDQVAMRDIAMTGLGPFAKTGRWSTLRRLIFRLLLPVTGAVLLIGVGGIALFDHLGGYRLPLVGVLLTLPAILARKFVESFALGAKQVARSIIGSQIAYPILLIIGTGWIWLSGASRTTTTITLAYAFAGFGSFLVALVLTRPVLRQLRGPISQNIAHSPQTILISGGHFALVSLGFVLGQHMDVLLTGALTGPDQAGLVRIASRVAEMAALIRVIVLLQYKPLLAEAYGKGDLPLLRARTRTMTILFVATGLPITAGLWLLSSQVMAVFGSGFAAGAPVMQVYLLGIFFTLLCGPCNSILAMCGQEHLASRIIWAAIAINFVADLILIPSFGAFGCASANLLSLLFLGTASSYFAVRTLSVNTTILSLWPTSAKRV